MATYQGSTAQKLVDIIQDIGRNHDTAPEWATVISTTPELRIRIDGMKIDVEEEDVAIPERLRGQLYVDDRVILMGMSAGQAYVVLDKY